MTDQNQHFDNFKKNGNMDDIDFNAGKKKSKYLGDYTDKFLVLLDLAKDIKNGKYKMHPAKITVLIATILYVISPVDAVPDFVPVAGWLDDAGIVALALGYLNHELEKYQNWTGV